MSADTTSNVTKTKKRRISDDRDALRPPTRMGPHVRLCRDDVIHRSALFEGYLRDLNLPADDEKLHREWFARHFALWTIERRGDLWFVVHPSRSLSFFDQRHISKREAVQMRDRVNAPLLASRKQDDHA